MLDLLHGVILVILNSLKLHVILVILNSLNKGGIRVVAIISHHKFLKSTPWAVSKISNVIGFI